MPRVQLSLLLPSPPPATSSVRPSACQCTSLLRLREYALNDPPLAQFERPTPRCTIPVTGSSGSFSMTPTRPSAGTVTATKWHPTRAPTTPVSLLPRHLSVHPSGLSAWFESLALIRLLVFVASAVTFFCEAAPPTHTQKRKSLPALSEAVLVLLCFYVRAGLRLLAHQEVYLECLTEGCLSAPYHRRLSQPLEGGLTV